MGSDDWRLLGKVMAGAVALGATLLGIVGTLLLWLEGLDDGEV